MVNSLFSYLFVQCKIDLFSVGKFSKVALFKKKNCVMFRKEFPTPVAQTMRLTIKK